MAERRAYMRRARHWLANRGWRGLLRELWYRAQLVAKGQPVPGRENDNTAPHPFDVQYSVDTSGLVWGEALPQKGTRDPAYWATGYYGISPSAFTAALQRLQMDWPRFTFLDIGCGKGRAILLALRFPFQRVIGVELSPALAQAAQRNLHLFQVPWRRPEVAAEVHQGDATTFALPSGPLLVFLYHPFAAPVMRRFLARLEEAATQEQRDIVILYANPELEGLFLEEHRIVPLWKDTFELTPEEGAADRFGSHGEIFAAFALR